MLNLTLFANIVNYKPLNKTRLDNYGIVIDSL